MNTGRHAKTGSKGFGRKGLMCHTRDKDAEAFERADIVES